MFNRIFRNTILYFMVIIGTIALVTINTRAAEPVVVISGFAPFDIAAHSIYMNDSCRYAEEELILMMPDSIGVYIDGSTNLSYIPVTWECVGDVYSEEDSFYYQYSPVWDSEKYVLSSELNIYKDAPYIAVFVNWKGGISDSDFDICYVSGKPAETIVYEYLTEKAGFNEAAACGIMANIYRESSFISNNLQNSYEKKLGYSDITYTSAVDSGEYTAFATDAAGYGLCQWTYRTRKAALLAYARELGVSISDANMQMGFLLGELRKNYPLLINNLYEIENSADGAYQAAYLFCENFEKPAQTNHAVSIARGNLASNAFWEEYGTVEEAPVIEQKNGMCQDDNGQLCYYKNGVIDSSYTDMIQKDDVWYYVQQGKVTGDYTGVVQHGGTWYYVQNSILRWGYTGMIQYNGTWYYIQNSVLRWGYTGMIQYNGTWYYIQNSTLRWGYTGMIQYNGTWYYIQNSTLRWGYTGMVQHNGTWYYIQNSTLRWGVNTLVQHQGDKQWYYVHNSAVDFTYTGYYSYNGVQYRIVNGKVVF